MRYLQHFSFDFLAVKGDGQIPFNLHRMGVAYVQEVFFFLVGFYYLTRNRTKKTTALICYLLVSPIASSFTFMTPAANRSFNMIIGWTIISGLGITIVLDYFKKKLFYKITLSLIVVVYLATFIFFLNLYFFTLPSKYPLQWHFGRNELVRKVSSIENNYDKVIISDSSGPAYIWFLFYKKLNPIDYQKNLEITTVPNEFGFLDVKSFGKYKFIKPFKWENIEKSQNYLYVSFEDDIPDDWSTGQSGKKLAVQVIDKVLYPNGKVAFKLVELKSI